MDLLLCFDLRCGETFVIFDLVFILIEVFSVESEYIRVFSVYALLVFESTIIHC